MSTQIAAQMYTLRDHCETPADIAKSCAKLKAMGYDAIQASAAGFNTIAAAELKKILEDAGLVCAATHRSLDQLKDAPAEIDFHAEIGCRYTALGGWGWEGNETREQWNVFVDEFSELATRYEGSPVKLGYHNHSHEFAPFGLAETPEKISPESTPYTVLEQKLGPAAFFEVDTYWVAHGGADPAAWLRRLAGRVPAIHVKDMTIDGDRQHKMCEVGAGNLNWPAILEAAKAAGVEWYIVERDNGDLDPFDSLKISLENLRSWGLS
ncbi:MAG: sugar phosphate isomerase/epimerase [Planctomycetota bacterium]